MATSKAAKSSKKCCISFLISKLGAKLLYLHQLRAKQSYLQNFTNSCCFLLYLDRWDKYLDILYHKLQFTGPPSLYRCHGNKNLSLTPSIRDPQGRGGHGNQLMY